METTINKDNPVEYTLEIHATADEIEPKLKEALKTQRKQMDVEGFRKGKVPLGLVKKMHGRQIGFRVAQQLVQEVFEEEVEESDDVEPLGQPTLEDLDYEVDGDLRAVLRFGVRPQVDIKDVSDEEISRLVYDVTDEDVEEEVERLRTQQADLMPKEEGAAEESDYVNIDLQRIDPQTDTPIIGEKEEDLSFFLDDDRLKDELRNEIIGKEAGTTFRVELPQGGPPQQQASEGGDTRLYEVNVKDIKRRDLPPVDAGFVREVTEGEFDDPDAFRQEIRDRLEDAWQERSRNMLQQEIVERMLDLHTVPVPESVTENFLDSFVDQVRQNNDGDLPDDFDETAFRERNRSDAQQQGRWMLIRDQIIDDEGIEVTDEDLEAFFAEQADEELSAPRIKQFYRSMPQMMERVEQQILSGKVYDLLIDRFDVQDKTPDEMEEEMAARHGHAHPHGEGAHDHGEEAAEGAGPETTEQGIITG
jgi:trigger factor